MPDERPMDHEGRARWRARQQRHRAMLAEQGATLERIGLPLRVYEDAGRWDDFLENGHLHWHEDPGRFDFEQLSDGQLRQLRAFLEGLHGDDESPPPLLRWLRVRQGEW